MVASRPRCPDCNAGASRAGVAVGAGWSAWGARPLLGCPLPRVPNDPCDPHAYGARVGGSSLRRRNFPVGRLLSTAARYLPARRLTLETRSGPALSLE